MARDIARMLTKPMILGALKTGMEVSESLWRRANGGNLTGHGVHLVFTLCGSSLERIEISSSGFLLILGFGAQNGIPARAGLTVGPCAPFACESLLD
jgi:hypothetical protein